MGQYYVTGGDSHYPLDKGSIAAQSFRVEVPHTLKTVILHMKLWERFLFPWVDLHKADADGAPIGELLSQSTWIALPDFFPGNTKPVQFPMRPFNLDTQTSYCLLARSSPGLFQFPPEWQYDGSAATYARGHRLSKHSGVDPWVHHYSHDHIFIESGPLIPPAPPVPSPETNWALLDIHYYPTPTDVKIVVYTDRTCHLWLRYTEKQPWRHATPLYRRGVYFRDGIRFCFVVYIDIEQEEEGDTYTHTFTLEDWPFCTWRWFYFHGSINNVNSKSASPIFCYHRLDLSPVLLFAESWSYHGPDPPALQLHVLEPWTVDGPANPPLSILHTEPWTYYSDAPPELESLFAEPWTHYSPPPPDFASLFSEPWDTP